MKSDPNTKKTREFNQSKNLVNAAYFFVVSVSFLAWNARFKGSLEGFSLPSLLVLLAFGFMWVHYLSAYLKANYQPDLDTKKATKVTQAFVLLAIIAHPVAIIYKLNEAGYGLPPASYKSFFGTTGSMFIALGMISLFAFLAYEFKSVLKDKPKVWSKILSLNDLAMILIVFHGFKLGFVINSGWFRYVWLGYGLSLLYFYYDTYVNKGKLKKYTEGFIVGLAILALAFVSLAVSGDSRSKPASRPTTTSEQTKNQDEEGYISLVQLSKNDGLEGRKCWVAVDSDVYDATGSPEWKDGQHTPSKGQAKCGQDLTQAIAQSPHGESVLGQLEIVGRYRGK